MTFSYGFRDYLAKKAARGGRFNSTFSLKQKTAYYISEGLDFVKKTQANKQKKPLPLSQMVAFWTQAINGM